MSRGGANCPGFFMFELLLLTPMPTRRPEFNRRHQGDQQSQTAPMRDDFNEG
jgi:hypothetical protein